MWRDARDAVEDMLTAAREVRDDVVEQVVHEEIPALLDVLQSVCVAEGWATTDS